MIKGWIYLETEIYYYNRRKSEILKKLERKSEIILFGTTLPHLTVLTAYLQFLICRRGEINLE